MGLGDGKEEPIEEITDEIDNSDGEMDSNSSESMPIYSMKQHLFYPFEKIPVISKKRKQPVRKAKKAKK